MTEPTITVQLPPAYLDDLRQRLALTKCTHDVDVSLGPPCSWCLADAAEPLIVEWLIDARKAGAEQSTGELRLFGAMLEQAEAESRRYRTAWQSARARARRAADQAEAERPAVHLADADGTRLCGRTTGMKTVFRGGELLNAPWTCEDCVRIYRAGDDA